MDCPEGTLIVATKGEDVLSSSNLESFEMIAPSDHEEADTRTLLHAAHMKSQGFESIVLRANDTDVLVLAIFAQAHLAFEEFWLSFGVGRNHKFIPVHEVVCQIGHSRALALPGFHAFTGSDVTSSINMKGKRTCYELWLKYPEFTAAFNTLSQMNPSKENIDEVFLSLNRYVARLFQAHDEYEDVDSLRLHLFLHKGKSFASMPPGSDALKLHTLRAAYLGGHIWGRTLVPIMNAPSPCEWGWLEFPHRFYPQYTSADIISRKLPNLKTCSCRVKCEPPCSCCVLDIPCIGLCGCMGNCFGKHRKKASTSNQRC